MESNGSDVAKEASNLEKLDCALHGHVGNKRIPVDDSVKSSRCFDKFVSVALKTSFMLMRSHSSNKASVPCVLQECVH